MSVTFSEVAIEALLEALGRPGRRGQRIVLSDLYGLPPAELFRPLEGLFDTSVEVDTGTDAGMRTVQAISTAPDHCLIVYLVDEETPADLNRGSAGFAATLRTQFLAGADPRSRTLLVLDPDPIDTVRSAAAHAGRMPELQWEALVMRAAARIQAGRPEGSPLLGAVAQAIVVESGEPGQQTAELFEAFCAWASRHAGGSPEAAGRDLHVLGVFLSDPAVATDPAGRLRTGAWWRRQLDERYLSKSKLWPVEAGKLLQRRHVTPAVAERVIAAAGPFGVDYGKFTLDDLGQQYVPPPPLTLHAFEPAAGPRAAITTADALVVWIHPTSGELRLRFGRPAELDDAAEIRWSTGERTEIQLVAAQQFFSFPLPQLEGDWCIGELKLESAAAAGRREISQTLRLAICRRDGSWFAVEEALAIAPVAGAFIAEGNPSVIAYGDGAAVLGRPDVRLPETAEDSEFVLCRVTFRDEHADLPLLLAGSAEMTGGPDGPGEPPDDGPVSGPDDDGPEDDEPEDDDQDDPPQEFPEPPDERDWLSIPHALLDASREEWPRASLLQQDDGSNLLVFSLGQQRRHLAPQHPAGVDGTALELAILERPELTAYAWSSAGAISRGPFPGIDASALPRELVGTFQAARKRFFAVAKACGSVYAVDPASAEATEYVNAYADLMRAVPYEQRYVAGWDSLLLCDAVSLVDTEDILVAPTSPIAVAFHAGLHELVAGWVRDGDPLATADVASLSMRHALPLVHAESQWYESVPIPELLWRRYTPLATEAPGQPERNARYIGLRLHAYLDVYPVYEQPEQELSVAFFEPPDFDVVLRALRSFFEGLKRRPTERLPQLHVSLVGGPRHLDRHVAESLASGRQDELDRVVQSRITISIRDSSDVPEFAHVAFLFRSPGNRAPRLLPMDDRPPTTFLSGLAAGPGRRVYNDRDQIFAWGTWARAQPDGGTYQELLRRGLELVGGQPAGKVTEGWTHMASTSLESELLDELYGRRADWVVHLDRLIGIEAFGERRHLIEYEERADTHEAGYDGITATERITPYMDAVGRALGPLGGPDEQPLRRLLQILNGVSGRLVMDLLKKDDNDILERIGFVAALSALDHLDGVIGATRQGTGVMVSLGEYIGGRQRAGLRAGWLPVPGPDSPRGDDLLLLWLPATQGSGPVTIRGTVIEVKYAGSGQADLDKASNQVSRTRTWLEQAFNVQGNSRPFRARDLAELLASAAARAMTFHLGREIRAGALDPAIQRVIDGQYELDLTHWRDGTAYRGLVVSVEAESEVDVYQGDLQVAAGATDLLRIGRPFLSRLVSGGKPSRPAKWAPMRFTAPQAGSAGPSGSDVGDSATREPTASAPASRSLPGREAAGAARSAITTAVDLDALAGTLDQAMAKYKLATEPFRPDLAQVGPNVIRFRTRPLGPLSVADVERRARDIGREIGAPGAVIVSQEPRYICVDVPREERDSVLYRNIAGTEPPPAGPGALSFILGVAPSGEIRTADLARLPHLLVAGATGSGKSVFLRGMLCHLVRTRGPAALRILLVDPKQLDFAGFAALPHLEGGAIVSDPAEAVEVLSETIERELEWRRPVLIDAGVTSATEFYEQGGSHEQLPQMVVLVDEFADLVGVLGKERRGFDELIQRYAQLTRAFGIYLVLATQRPSVDVITGSIKANLTARVALSLPSHRDSMTILDRPGAEDLLGNGDMLFYHGGRVERLQGTYADQNDVLNAVERWRGVPNPGSRS